MYWRFLHIEMQDLHTPNFQKRTRKNLAEVDLQGFVWSILLKYKLPRFLANSYPDKLVLTDSLSTLEWR